MTIPDGFADAWLSLARRSDAGLDRGSGAAGSGTCWALFSSSGCTKGFLKKAVAQAAPFSKLSPARLMMWASSSAGACLATRRKLTASQASPSVVSSASQSRTGTISVILAPLPKSHLELVEHGQVFLLGSLTSFCGDDGVI